MTAIQVAFDVLRVSRRIHNLLSRKFEVIQEIPTCPSPKDPGNSLMKPARK